MLKIELELLIDEDKIDIQDVVNKIYDKIMSNPYHDSDITTFRDSDGKPVGHLVQKEV